MPLEYRVKGEWHIGSLLQGRHETGVRRKAGGHTVVDLRLLPLLPVHARVVLLCSVATAALVASSSHVCVRARCNVVHKVRIRLPGKCELLWLLLLLLHLGRSVHERAFPRRCRRPCRWARDGGSTAAACAAV